MSWSERMAGRMSRRWFVGLALLLSLTACGWRLQGAYDLPPRFSPVYVQDSGSGSRLGYELRDQLRLAGIAQADTPAKAATVIAIRGDHFQRQILAVDRAGKGRDYGAILSAEYEVLHGGKPLQPKRSVQRRRDYLVSQAEGDPLTDEQRALEITDALRRDVAREILRQLTIQANAS